MAEKVTIEAVVNASITKVWDCWTKPEHISKWNFASDDWHCPSAENDVRVGGKSSTRMEAKDGSFGFDFTVIYDVVIDFKELSYTMEDGRKATTVFENKGEQTSITTVFDAETENAVELQQQGWQMILNNFKKYTENS
jgi:uncharacterized protein YndB with AHSA1/START domain